MAKLRILGYLLLTTVVLLGPGTSRVRAGENPLAPPATSSPRETIESLIGCVEEMYQIAKQSESAFERRARLLPKAQYLVRCFDVREIAPSVAERSALQAAIYLKEIFDRIELPPLAKLPDLRAAKAESLKRYRIPGTEITLVRVEAGVREGEYLFSGETIQRAGEYYERVRDLPYKPSATTRGLYRTYTTLQGWLIPAAWVEAMPAWCHATILDQELWKWFGLACLGLVSVLILVRAFRISRGRPASPDGVTARHVLLRFVFPVTWMALALCLDFLLTTQVRFTGRPLITIKLALEFQLVLAAIVAVLAVFNGIAEGVIHARRLRPGGIDGQLVRLGFRVLTFVVVAWVTITGADYLGMPVTPLVAGIGVSGLAVALAAQYTVENLIAGLVLFADKPVRVGEFCKFGEKQGTVEQIGLRSTRIRAADRTVITVPNAEFAKQHIINVTRRDQVQLKATLQLRYETTPDQLRYVLVRLRELLRDHPQLDGEKARVRFVAFGASSLDLEVHALARTSDSQAFLAIQEDVLLRIMEIVEESGTGFAFSSHMHYTASDLAIDESRVRAAEEQVRGWRAKGLLAASGFLPDEEHIGCPPPHLPTTPAAVHPQPPSFREGWNRAPSTPN